MKCDMLLDAGHAFGMMAAVLVSLVEVNFLFDIHAFNKSINLRLILFCSSYSGDID